MTAPVGTYAADGSLNVTIAGGSIVVGPASETDGAIALWNGTNGGTLKDSKVIVTIPASAATLTLASGKTLTVSNTLTFAGTDATVMTFPTTSATIARTDAANTFTGTQTLTGTINVGASATIGFTGRVRMQSPADSIITIWNAATTDFDRLQFGGTTSSFPSLKRNSTGLSVRLADDSGAAPLTSGAITATSITFSSTSGVIGTTTNDSAAAGSVGEYQSTTVVSGSAVALVTNTAKTIMSFSLTAGDWDVYGNVILKPAATTSLSQWYASVSQTNNTQDFNSMNYAGYTTTAFVPGLSNDWPITVPGLRISLSGTTTIYLVAQATFTISTLAAYGKLWARRVR